jgi:hypothetical protein
MRAAGARANRRRSEIEAVIDGEQRILCLMLDALAELETAFSADNLVGLAERFSRGQLKAADMIRIIGAGLRGGVGKCSSLFFQRTPRSLPDHPHRRWGRPPGRGARICGLGR